MASPIASILQGPPSPFQQLLDMADDPSAPDVAGALSATGSTRNEDDLQVDRPEGAQGALSAGGNKTPFDKWGTELLEFGGGPLAQANALKDARQQAAQKKRDALENAKIRIKDLDKLMPDPQRAWALGIGAPTRTGRFSEAISNAAMMRQGAMDERRAAAVEQAKALNTLDIAQAGVGWDEATAEGQAQDQRQRLAEQFFTQGRLADQNREAIAARMQRERELNEYRDAQIAQRTADRESREDLAERGRYTWSAGQGPGPDGKEVAGSYRYPTTGDDPPVFFPGVKRTTPISNASNAPTTLEKNAKFYVDNGIAKDIPEAVGMLRESVQNPGTFQRLVQAEKKLIMENNFGIEDATAEQQAIKNVRARAGALATPPGEPIDANTPTNPGFKTNFPLPQQRAGVVKADEMKPPASAAAPAAAPAGGAKTLPPQVASRLKEGVVTTFSGGEKWTLKNGKPVRLQ